VKICTIIGARPQFIKAATLSRAIKKYNTEHIRAEIQEVIIHTGQHYDHGMSDIFFRELKIPDPEYNLGVGSGTHGRQTGQMLMKIEDVLLLEKPDWVLIYGDTNSTLAGALAASKLHIRVAHVEAGLRSFNRLMPEEINRVVSDRLSHLLLCPSQVAVNNLAAEGIIKGVTMVGDVMADALQFALQRIKNRSEIGDILHLKHKAYLLVTIHRAENTDNRVRLQNIVGALNSIEETTVLPIHPRTNKILKDMNCLIKPHIKLIDPVGYLDMIALENSARMILTDSGGIQKEAYWLQVPCITLRDETEWVETVENGWNKLTGANSDAIINTVYYFTPPPGHPTLYGDGQAAHHALQAIAGNIEREN
jgi:UDP-GlcNAc3NAcA epimerase